MKESIQKNRYLAFRDDIPPGSIRLFCFPYAGGGASIFYRWQNNLPAAIQPCPVQLPGRENRIAEPPFESVISLRFELGDCLDPYLDRPFALFGHSMGALIAFELARELRRREKPLPSHLFVSGRRAPQVTANKPPIHQLPDSEFMDELRMLQGTPEEVLANEELIQLVLPTLRADFALCETYRYYSEEPFDFPITALAGTGDADTSLEEIGEWRRQTDSQFRLHELPGNHFFLNTQSREILRIIEESLLPLVSNQVF